MSCKHGSRKRFAIVEEGAVDLDDIEVETAQPGKTRETVPKSSSQT